MRPVPALLAVLAAVLTPAGLAAAALHAAPDGAQGHFPVWALFSFAVSAFREPLR